MYITAFRGRRDSYQVPIALAEAGRLQSFFTDIYATPSIRLASNILPSPLNEKLRNRKAHGLPKDRVHCLWWSAIREWGGRLLGKYVTQTIASLDPCYSVAAKQHAEATGGDLFLYTNYAWEAFTAKYTHSPKRVLFQVHPHLRYEREVLMHDAANHPELDFTMTLNNTLPEEHKRRREDVWKYADAIICASSFTKNSMVAVGANPSVCHVIPYGVDMAKSLDVKAYQRDGFHALFVGSGVQRKGLHHLLIAWKGAHLPKNSSITLVCRNIDPALKSLVGRGKKCDFISWCDFFGTSESVSNEYIIRNAVSCRRFWTSLLRSFKFWLPCFRHC